MCRQQGGEEEEACCAADALLSFWLDEIISVGLKGEEEVYKGLFFGR